MSRDADSDTDAASSSVLGGMLRYWPMLVLIAGLASPLVLSTWYTFNKQQTVLENAFELELTQVTSVLANGVSEPIWNLTPELGRPLMNSIMADERVIAVRVTSYAQGEFLQAARTGAATADSRRSTHAVVRGNVPIGEVYIDVGSAAVGEQLNEQWPEIYALGVMQGLVYRLRVFMATSPSYAR